MKKRNFLTTATLAALVAAQMAMPVMAKTGNNDTTIGIAETKVKPSTQVSADVPLYLVVAAVENQEVIEKPNNYQIKNETENLSIGVTKMQIENLGDYTGENGNGWAIVDGNNGNPTIANKRQIALQLGTLWMPDTTQKPKNEKVVVDIPAGSTFRDVDQNGKEIYKAITKANPMQIAVNGKVLGTNRDNKNATSQFKVTYTLSPLDDAGKVFTAAYAGDIKEDAGLAD